jgi:glucose-6-phosphate 1-epimerase
MASPNIPERLRRFEIPGRVALLEGNGEMPKIEVTSQSSRVEIYLHGAHVTDFRKKGEAPLLFTSQFSRFVNDQPIRGGVPIIFPWFGPREGEPMHGYARNSEWDLHEAIIVPDDGVSLRFSLPVTAESATWPAFTANYVVTVTDVLKLDLIVTNAEPNEDFTFENCLHTYFGIGDINTVSISGLKGANYIDKVDNFAHHVETSDALKIASEVDRVYMDTPGAIEISDPALKRKIRIDKSGSASTVVWNPWIAKSRQMPDFGNEEYKQMLCVESGNVGKNKVTLPPGKSAVLSVTISSTSL